MQGLVLRILGLYFHGMYTIQIEDNFSFALLYLRFALWWLHFKLQSGPDAFKKGRVAGFHLMSSLFHKLKKRRYLKNVFKSITRVASFASARGTVVESDRK